MTYPTKTLWSGYGPPGDSGLPAGLSVVHGVAALRRVLSPLGAPHADKADLPVDWPRAVLLFVRAPDEVAGRTPAIVSLTRDGDEVTVTAELRGGTGTAAVDVQPWLLAEAPSAAFAGAPSVTLRFGDGGAPALPVAIERD